MVSKKGSLLYGKPETTRGEKKERSEERDEIVVPIDIKDSEYNNSVAKRQENGHRWPKVFRNVSAILYRFIPRLTGGGGGDRDKTGGQRAQPLIGRRRLEFPGQKANLSQCKLRYISLLPVSMIFFPQFSSNQQRKLAGVIIWSYMRVSIAPRVEWASADKS